MSVVEFFTIVGGIAAVAAIYYPLHKALADRDTALRRVRELEEQLRKDREDFAHLLKITSSRRENDIEWQQQEIKRLHDGIERIVKESDARIKALGMSPKIFSDAPRTGINFDQEE